MFSILLAQCATGQGLYVVKDVKQYEKIVALDSNQRMVSIGTITGIQFDLRYATTNNFTHQQLYPRIGYSYLRLAAAKALDKVQGECTAKGYSLKIFDAYRPYSVSQKMWTLIQDERYVANPVNGSGHNRGTTVDLTLVDAATGKNLDMGTDFDNFTDSAHHDFKNLLENVLKNRKFLRELMEKYGFKALETEWWHYSFGNSKDYDVMDLSFGDLKREAHREK
ncbi:M15 family metallopeptidase [Chitinophagaceae bacterium 26-R-25]|nr:M15 family metallopeptidase [Chitinophagaceae bacterium 26-R-25]